MAIDPIILPIETTVTGLPELNEGINKLVQFGESALNAAAGIDTLSESQVKTVETTNLLTKAMLEQARAVAIDNEEIIRQAKAIHGDVTAEGELVAATEAATEATEQQTAATRGLISAEDIQLDYLAKLRVAQIEGATATEIGAANYSKFHQTLTQVASTGTPAVLKAATWGTLAVGGVAYEAIKTYTSFNKTLVQSITQAGRPLSSLNFLTNSAMQTSMATGVALNDVANIIYRVSSATAGMNDGFGATNKQVAAMTKQIAILGVIGNINGGAPMEQSARVMGALMNANLGGTGTDPSKIAAFINAMTGAGDVKQSDVISSLGRGILATAAAKNISASSVGSYIDLLTSQGVPGSTAGTYAKTAFSLLTAPGAQAAKAMAMIGISAGQLNQLLAGKNGITDVAEYIHQQLGKFDASKFNVKYKGQTGIAGATALLENWGVGNIPQSVITAWATGKLKDLTAAQLGTTESGPNGTAVSGQDWLSTLQNLIITKAFGGSRSAASVLALSNDPSKVAGIQANINRNMTPEALARSKEIAFNTPGAQFARMKQSIMVDLVKIGKALTPPAIILGKVFTGLADVITKFKPVILGLGIMLAKILFTASKAKLAQFGLGVEGLLGAGALKKSQKLEEQLTNLRDESGFRGRLAKWRLEQLERGYGGPMNAARIKQAEAAAKENKSAALFGVAGKTSTGIEGLTTRIENLGVSAANTAKAVEGEAIANGGIGGSGGRSGRTVSNASKSSLKAEKQYYKEYDALQKIQNKKLNNFQKSAMEDYELNKPGREYGYNGALRSAGVGVRPLSEFDQMMFQNLRAKTEYFPTGVLDQKRVDRYYRQMGVTQSKSLTKASIKNIQPHLDMIRYAENATPEPKVSLLSSLKYRLTGGAAPVAEALEGDAAQDAEKGVLGKVAGGLLGKVGGGLMGMLGGGGGGLMGMLGGGGGGLMGMLGGGLSMAGGPMGMMLMSTLGPLMMPLMGKALSGIGHFFGGLFGGGSNPVTAYKPKTNIVGTGLQDAKNLTANILTAEATLEGLKTKIGAGKATDAEFREFKTLTDQVAGWEQEQKIYASLKGGPLAGAALVAAKKQAKALSADVALQTKMLSGNKVDSLINKAFSSGDFKGALKAAGIKGQEAADIAKIFSTPNLSQNQIVAMTTKRIAAQKSADVQNQINNPLITMSTDPTFFKRVAINSLTANQSKLLLNTKTNRADYLLTQSYTKGLDKPGEAVAREATFLRAKIQATESAKADTFAAAQLGGLKTAAGRKLLEEAGKLEAKAAKFKDAAEKVARTQNLSKSTVSALSKAIVSGIKNSNVEIGLTAPGLAAAFSSAIGVGGMKTLLQKIDSDLKALA